MLRVGDYVEVLKPENKLMDQFVGSNTRIKRVFRVFDGRLGYVLENSECIWFESNLKLLNKNENPDVLDVGETVIVTKGRHEGEIDTVVDCDKINGNMTYALQKLRYHVNRDEVKPLKQMTGLF